MYWIIFFILFFSFFLIKFGKKENFDLLETYWMFYFFVFWSLMIIPIHWYYKLLILLIVLTNRRLRTMVSFYHSFFIIFAKKEKFTSLQRISFSLFQKSFDFKKEIIIFNYPCNYIEYFLPLIFGKKVCLLIFEGGFKIAKYLWGKENLISISKNSFEKVQDEIQEKIKNGYIICTYFERKYFERKYKNQISEPRTGIFKIAQNTQIPLRMVKYSHINHVFGIVDDFDVKLKISDSEKIIDYQSFIQKKLKSFYK